jgi:hypothetical protein
MRRKMTLNKSVDPVKRTLLILAVVLLSISVPAMAQDEKPLGPDKWPTTVEAVVDDIIGTLSPEDKETVRNTQRENLILFHHGWGTGLRNHYGLWRGNSQLIESACGKPCHPDDASMIIIEKVWEALQR